MILFQGSIVQSSGPTALRELVSCNAVGPPFPSHRVAELEEAAISFPTVRA
jgi:hypothetical protein